MVLLLNIRKHTDVNGKGNIEYTRSTSHYYYMMQVNMENIIFLHSIL